MILIVQTFFDKNSFWNGSGTLYENPRLKSLNQSVTPNPNKPYNQGGGFRYEGHVTFWDFIL